MAAAPWPGTAASPEALGVGSTAELSLWDRAVLEAGQALPRTPSHTLGTAMTPQTGHRERELLPDSLCPRWE